MRFSALNTAVCLIFSVLVRDCSVRARHVLVVFAELLGHARLVRVTRAGDRGLIEDRLAGKPLFHLAVGYRPRPGAHPARGLIESRPVMAPTHRTCWSTAGT